MKRSSASPRWVILLLLAGLAMSVLACLLYYVITDLMAAPAAATPTLVSTLASRPTEPSATPRPFPTFPAEWTAVGPTRLPSATGGVNTPPATASAGPSPSGQPTGGVTPAITPTFTPGTPGGATATITLAPPGDTPTDSGYPGQATNTPMNNATFTPGAYP